MNKNRIRLLICLGAALVAALVLVATASAAHHKTVTVVKTATNAKLNETILVAKSGRTLYHWKGETTHKWMCTGSCTQMWLPLLVPKSAAHAKLGKVSGLSKAKRPDGKMQITFKGMPLYRYIGDSANGQANGQGLDGVWFAIKHAALSSPAPSPTPQPNPTPNPYPGY